MTRDVFCNEKKMGLFRKAIQDDFVIVAISSGLTMDVDNNSLMVAAIKGSKPSHWEMMNPDGYTAFFRSNGNGVRLQYLRYEGMEQGMRGDV